MPAGIYLSAVTLPVMLAPDGKAATVAVLVASDLSVNLPLALSVVEPDMVKVPVLPILKLPEVSVFVPPLLKVKLLKVRAGVVDMEVVPDPSKVIMPVPNVNVPVLLKLVPAKLFAPEVMVNVPLLVNVLPLKSKAPVPWVIVPALLKSPFRVVVDVLSLIVLALLFVKVPPTVRLPELVCV